MKLKLSQLIEQAQKIMAEHGDLTVINSLAEYYEYYEGAVSNSTGIEVAQGWEFEDGVEFDGEQVVRFH